MAKPNISLLGATYSGVSGVSLPKSGGGTATFPWVEGSQTVTENDTYNVTNLAELVVNVSAGTNVDLHVVGGTTQPANPEQNTIWVKTSTAITSYELQHDAPDTPAEGMIWIQTSYFSYAPMDILPDNGVKVYPIAAYQYESGAWVEKEAKSYIDGAWKDWVVYVWNGEADISHWVRATGSATGAWSYTADGFLMTTTNSSGGIRLAYDIPYDLTNVASVRYYGYGEGGGTNRYVSVVSESAGMRGNSAVQLNVPSSWPKTDPLTYVDLDVSTLTGNHYIRIGGNSANNKTLYFKRVVLIPIGGNI